MSQDLKSIYQQEVAKTELQARLINGRAEAARRAREKMEADYLVEKLAFIEGMRAKGYSEMDILYETAMLYPPRVSIRSITEMTRATIHY